MAGKHIKREMVEEVAAIVDEQKDDFFVVASFRGGKFEVNCAMLPSKLFSPDVMRQEKLDSFLG